MTLIINKRKKRLIYGEAIGTVLRAKFFNEVIESKLLDPLDVNKLNQNIEKLIK